MGRCWPLALGALRPRLCLPAPQGFTYCAEEGREGKRKQNRTKQNGENNHRTLAAEQQEEQPSPFPNCAGERLGPRGARLPGLRRRRGGRERPTYHDRGRRRGCLGCHRGLVGLVLRSFDFGLQVCRRVKIFAFLPHATPLYVIHTNGYGVVVCVDHCAVRGVCEAAVGLSAGTVSSLELPAYLGHTGDKSRQCRRRPEGRLSATSARAAIYVVVFMSINSFLSFHGGLGAIYNKHLIIQKLKSQNL